MNTAAFMGPISSKLRTDEKKRLLETCDAIDTTLGNAIRMFVSAFDRQGGFPFEPANPHGFSAETLQAMDDEAITGRFHYLPEEYIIVVR